ncbi:MAG: hypothetical protein QGG36_13615 [Pirellulaceae bacterium]|jgi:hypothetical protein|nr:hypothetical protein [Pirellulaceae bacterium]MDP7016835.1 hypothetical protein [Pirellulaceae bacterium]
MSRGSVPPLQQVIDDISRSWLKIAGVAGLGVGENEGTPCVKVFFCDERSLRAAPIPDQVGGYPVVKEVGGEFFADS